MAIGNRRLVGVSAASCRLLVQEPFREISTVRTVETETFRLMPPPDSNVPCRLLL